MIYSEVGSYGNIPVTGSAAGLQSFLEEAAQYPLFCKPVSASKSVGSVLIERLESGDLIFGNGRRFPIEEFCSEIARDYPMGYLLQSAIRQHPDMSDVIGTAVGTVRIVTVREQTRPGVLYGLWKIPSPDAMSDNFWQDGSILAPIDTGSGRTGQCRTGSDADARDVHTHPVSGRPLTGVEIPYWKDACDAVARAHALFPQFGVIGWDVSITEDGPLIVEANQNPFHSLYQIANLRGIGNPDFQPIFDRTTAKSAELFPEEMKKRGLRNLFSKS